MSNYDPVRYRLWYAKNAEKKLAYARDYYAKHKQERIDYSLAYREKNPGCWRKSHRKKRYGLDEFTYERMFKAQDGKCAICSIKFDYAERNTKPHVDHDHSSGKVRGLLCHVCNVGLGQIERPGFLEAALKYLGAR